MLLKMAFRNVLRQKRRSLFTILAMVVGFAFASIMIGWQDGSYNYIIDIFTRAYLGHIQIHVKDYLDEPSIYKNIENYESVGDSIMNIEGVEAWAPRLFAAGLASVGEQSTAVQITGIDPILENNTTNFDKRVKEGESLSENQSHNVLIGKGLAKSMEAKIGDTLVIVSQAADGSIANDMYRIIGFVESGDVASDRMSVYMSLDDAQELMVLEGRVHELVVIISELEEVDKYVKLIEKKLNEDKLEVLSWKEVNKTFYETMQADRVSADVMYSIIMLIVAIGVLNTILMAVLERTREFGLLKALGTRPLQVFVLIMVEVLLMSIIGIAVGTVIGTTGNYILSKHGIKITPMDVAGITFDTMIAEINAKSIVAPSILILITSIIVSLIPAFKAARTVPAKTMRFH